MGAFICQISEKDWIVSRRVGVYGNREGSERNGKPVFFAKSTRGQGVIQSIIEDLVGMRRGDIVLFHVVKKEEGESSIHGVYSVTEEPFFNDTVKVWKSSPHFVYPYRFCFAPHPQHAQLCTYDVSMTVSEFYRLIETRKIRSISTLEREVRGAAHAVKKITLEDAEEVTKSLYGLFQLRKHENAVEFRPTKMRMQPLRDRIQGVGRIEFAVKAIVAYRLGQSDPELTQHIPACSDQYDFLIETFVGQTVRKPTDIFVTGQAGSEKMITIIEAKVDRANTADLSQALRYWEIFKLRNVDRGSLTYKISTCLLARRFHDDLTGYVAIRNKILPEEKVVLLRYTPTEDGKDARFDAQETAVTRERLSSITCGRISTPDALRELSLDPNAFCRIFPDKKLPPHIFLEFASRKNNDVVLRKCYRHEDQTVCLSHIFVRDLLGRCDVVDLAEFMGLVRSEATAFGGDLRAVEPILLASDYDELVKTFIQNYNQYEAPTGRHPISTYLHIQ